MGCGLQFFMCTKKGDNLKEVSPYVFPAGVEPTSSEPESEILSIELRERFAKIYYFLDLTNNLCDKIESFSGRFLVSFIVRIFTFRFHQFFIFLCWC